MRRNLIQSVRVWGCVCWSDYLWYRAFSGPGRETLFEARCSACHGPDGKGEVPMGKKLGVADLTSTQV